MQTFRIGVDVGGTFTDLVLLNEKTGEVYEIKVLTTSPNPAEGVLDAICRAIDKIKEGGEAVRAVFHGTTIATNSLLERRGAKTALITSRGCRDVLEIGRQIRPSLFDWNAEKPPPLVPRKWRYEADERIMSDGTVLASPKKEEILDLLEKIEAEGIEAVAVSFLFSFIDNTHEAFIEELIKRKKPHLTLCISSKVLPEYREYERTSTVCANAFITGVLNRYTDRMNQALSEIGLAEKLRLLQSNGGVATVEALKDRWITTVLSGPSGGVTASSYLAKQKQIPNLISMDIGGTSCDICLIKDYLADWTVESSIGGLPIRSPMIDVKSIGAGGGSIIWVDSGGALRVGPKSTGSDPGPVCYGKGGQQPAITDAHLIAGAVHPKSFADKGIKIDFKAAQTALEELGRTIGLSAEEVATGAIEVMNHSIAHAIRVAAMGELGGFAMVAFGGAGPLHACPVAEQLGIDRILLPDFAGVFSANGAALADYRYDFVQGHPKRMDEVNESELEDIFKRLVKMGEMKFKELPSLENRIDRSVELRYLGQSFEINVPVADKGSSGLNKQDILQRFHRLHEENYGYSDTREPVELV
ncbi:MAG: hydantoinase/oxoprolinase family protein, partial [Deltaproteobacteria bacterium]|nr:hydantoinase/oxoprolinase family protein [Deltaproteobacteria bacterium]